MGEICIITWAISPLTNGQITPVIINFRPISSCDLQFPADHVPVRFSCGRPTLALHLGLDFAWLMRWEPEDALDWGERTRSRTVRTFLLERVL